MKVKKIKRERKDLGKIAHFPNAFEVWRQLDSQKAIDEWRKLLHGENSDDLREKEKKEVTTA